MNRIAPLLVLLAVRCSSSLNPVDGSAVDGQAVDARASARRRLVDGGFAVCDAGAVCSPAMPVACFIRDGGAVGNVGACP